MKQTLPAGAVDVYYRDEIGNISTSHLWEVESGPVMDVIPRYPLFGGWKIGFYFGYNLPSTKYLFMDDADSSHYVLETPFASCFPDISIDQLVVRIILPEGAKYVLHSVGSLSTGTPRLRYPSALTRSPLTSTSPIWTLQDDQYWS